MAEKLAGTDVPIPGESVEAVVWSADGSKLYAATHADDEHYSHDKDLKHYVYDLTTRKHTELKLPVGHHLKDVSPDGTLFLTKAPRANPSDAHGAFLVPAPGGEPVLLNRPNEVLYDGRFSPDGKRVLIGGFRWRKPPAAQPSDGPAVPPPATSVNEGWLITATVNDPGRRTELPLKEREYVNQCAWSPDGRRVATSRQVLPELNQPAPPREIVITDTDGRNPKTINTPTENHLEPVFLDWR